VDIPSFLVKAGEDIGVHEGIREQVLIRAHIGVAAATTLREW
jgi:hypothetical protein